MKRGSISILLFTIISTFSSAFGAIDAEQPVIVQKEVLSQNFRQPKNILLGSFLGGASHVAWTLSILDELSKRGHNVTFVTREIHRKFTEPYPHFNTIFVEGDSKLVTSALANEKQLGWEDFIANAMYAANADFETDYPVMKEIMKDMDVAICDFASINGCYEAALDNNKPYIVSGIYGSSADAAAPYVNNDYLHDRGTTTIYHSFMERFSDAFILPVKLALKVIPHITKLLAVRHEMGCYHDSFAQAGLGEHKDRLKIINNLYGIEAARPIGPLVEFVGPIIPPLYNPLTADLKQFLDSHSRVIYVGFGQHAVFGEKELTLVLTAVMENIENGTYDAFLWAARLATQGFPKTVTTKSGNVYNVEHLFDGLDSRAKFVDWTPQTAVVMHSSVSVFLTHGGIGSFFEGLYAGKRLIVIPFMFDQFANAHTARDSKLGDYLHNKLDQNGANEMLQRVGLDVGGVYQKNVNRYKALIQIHSNNGIIRGANLVEEVLFASDDHGLLPYRIEASKQMSYIKAHNIDIYTALAAILLTVATLIFAVIRKVVVVIFFKEKLLVMTKFDKSKTN